MATAKEKIKYVGSPLERVEDNILLQGKAQYSDHLPTRAGTAHAAILRSPHAHAKINSISINKAKSHPGVLDVLTGDDVKEMSEAFLIVLRAPINQWALAVERVRYVGEPVAIVIARDRYIAEDAVGLIEVDYSPLPPAIDQEEATKDDAPVVHEAAGSNVVSTREFSYGEPEKAFAEADKVVKVKIRYPRNSQTPLEGFVVNAEYIAGEDLYDVASNYQGPFTSHPVMSMALRVKNSQLRMRTPQWSGGGFGIKVQIFPYVVLMCLASKRVGRPVKWVEDKLEHLAAAAAAPNRVIELEAACKSDGTVTAFKFDQLDDYGAFLRAPMPGPLYRMHGILTGAYDIKNLTVRNRVVLTNKCPSAMVRGFGGPQMYYGLERVMHKVAVELGLDPLEVLKKNLVPAGVFPYRAAAGALLDSGDYPKAVELGVEKGHLADLKKRRDQARAEGKLYGIGYAAIVEPAQSNMGYLSNILPHEERQRNPKGGAAANATITVDPLGTVSVTADSIPQGQGHQTILSQIVADELGLTPENIKVNLDFDTAKDAWSIATGNYSSRFSSATTVACYKAAQKIKDKLARIASQTLNVPPKQIGFADGMVFDTANPENSIKFYRAAGAAHWTPGALPEGMEPCVRETGSWSPPELESPNEQDQINTSLTYGFVFDYCGVEIDRDTGAVKIDKYVTTHDSGTILNPLIADGQVFGAFAWGVGCALYEEFVYGEDGSFKTGTFADYLVPTIHEVPEPKIIHMESPSMVTPLGAKGIAEGNCMSTPVCIANAVADATGEQDLTLPLIASKVARIVHGEEPPPPSGDKVEESHATDGLLRGDGETVVPASSDLVWETLLNPEALAAVIPGCHKLDEVEKNSYQAEVSLGVGPVRGKFRAKVALSDIIEGKSTTLSGGLEGPLGTSSGVGHVVLSGEDGKTIVTYDYAIKLSGTVASVGGRMLEGAAKALVKQFFNRLTAQITGQKDSGSSSGGSTNGLWAFIKRILGLKS
ncbi:MAG: molybdopterin cofactor-binding domain-containing protein [Pseudomonadota bacterium]|nr:molybdopterin cofactor-binding domain-containing protein [Pseudomonadota bacterium]